VPRDPKLIHGPLPSCPVCGTKLEYLKVVKFDAPFLCIQCKAELQIAKSESIFRASLTFAVSIVVGFMLGLRGWGLGIGTGTAVLSYWPTDCSCP
jgi:hypothetical protein